MKSITVLLLLIFVIITNYGFAQENKERDFSFPDLEGPYMGQKPPGMVAEPFAPGIISKGGWEIEGVFAPGMKEFYFTTRSSKEKPSTIIGFRQQDNVWKKYIEFKRNGEITFSPDGSRIHMAEGYKDRNGDGWSERKSLGSMFDRKDWGIMRLTASSKGTYVFDDFKSGDVIRISTLKDGKRQAPKKIGSMVNTGKWTAHPFIAPDENYLIWDCEKEGGYGKSDLYISFRQKDGSWGSAINMGDKVNSNNADIFASVTPDGKYILFNRRIDDGSNNDNLNVDIYWVDAQIIETLRPLQSSVEESNRDTASDLIKKVETGLPTQVYIAGDSTWSIEERMEHYGIPGASIAVIHNGEIAWTKGYGVVDKENKAPVTEQTLFQAAATSMPVTAYGALRLVEQNKVGLDENINRYLKSWKLPDNEFTKEKKVTIRNLLNHSAGIHPRSTGSYSINEKIPTLVEILSGTSPATNEPITVNKKPGESVRFAYASYVPIQQMMLDVEGKTFPEIMHELVLQPLEMNNSMFNQSLTTAQLKKVATGYLQDGSMVKGRRNINPSMASNGLWTTAEDYAKFITNIQQTLEGKRTKGLSKNLTELMGTPYGVSNSGWSFTLGLGFQLLNRNGEIYLRHHGWNTGFQATIMAHRDKGYGVVVMTNSNFPAFNAEVIRSVALAYEWDNYVPVYKKLEIEPSLANEITGRYMSNGKIVAVFQKDNQLFYKNILDLQAEELVKVSDSNFVKRNSSRLIQFKPNSENETVNLLFINRNDGTIVSTFVKMDTDEKEPIEFLLEGDFENALNAYKVLIEQHPTLSTVREDYLNDLGNSFLNEDRMKLSQNTFKVNMMLYPDSFQVYHSYAKACMKIGEIDLAILNYSKSLELNPENNNAKDMLKELQKSE